MTNRHNLLERISQVLVSITILNLTHLTIKNQEEITPIISLVGHQVLIIDSSLTTILKISTKANPLPTSHAITNHTIIRLAEDFNQHSISIQEIPNQAEAKAMVLIKINMKVNLDKGTTIKNMQVHLIPTKKIKLGLNNSFRCTQTKEMETKLCPRT